MAFTSIDPNKIKVGDPITKDLLNIIKDSLDDLNTRVQDLVDAGVTTYVINGDVSFYGYDPADPSIFYYKVRNLFSISDFRVQLFSKQGISTGVLSLDLQKSPNTNDATFESILNSSLNIPFSTSLDYSQHVSSIDGDKNDLQLDEVLRVKVLSLPAGFTGKILISISG
jgi:hypothetical protein